MSNWGIAVDNWWLLLPALLILPILWMWSYRSLAGLGRLRRVLALLLRSAVLLLLLLAAANLQLRRANDRLTVIYLLDQSESIPPEQRQAMVDYVVREVELHRNDTFRDRASVIAFGRNANIEVPPLDDDLPLLGRLETAANLRTDATNLEAAMKLAQATFPEDSARRLVVVTDGNENMGDAAGIARQLVKDGVGIDVVPVRLERRAEIAVERVSLPSDIRKGQPFEARVVLHNLDQAGAPGADPVPGRLRLIRRRGRVEQTLDEVPVMLEAGKTVFRFQDEIDEPDFYEYQAVFAAAGADDDVLTQNNRATAFTHVRGTGHVLLIEDIEHRGPNGEGEFRHLASRLRQNDLQVTVQFTDSLFISLADLQRFDTVILANVARSSGIDADQLFNFSDEQVQMLVRNTQQMGCGLVMLGGADSFGAGGWANTELEKAMPVDFQIRNVKVQAVGALVMVMHASEMAEGNHWQKVIAREALKALGPQDYCGLIHWSDQTFQEDWLWGKPIGLVKVGQNRPRMVALLDRMTPGDMPEFDPALKMAASGFNAVPKAAVKHMIIISDGDPTAPRGRTLTDLKKLGVQCTTVAVGTHGAPGSTPLQRIATFTGGKYYVVGNPRALPRIYQREARRVARPLIVERDDLIPQRTMRHEILRGIDSIPPINGFVMTTRKENPLVEVSLVSPFPSDQQNATLLATWNYGLGRTVVFTSDAGKRWANWTEWENYDKFFTQLVRWSMRPTGDAGNFTVSTQLKDGKVQVVVDALDKDDEFLNFLNLSASVVNPTMQSADLSLRQTAPGRYMGQFEIGAAGSYFLTLIPGPGQAPLRTGIDVPYSPEYRDREANETLLETMVSLHAEGRVPGRLIGSGLRRAQLDELLATNTFRRDLPKAISSNYVWPWLVLIAGGVFFADVFVRRVALDFAWVGVAARGARDAMLRREPAPVPDQRLERLRSRKMAATSQFDQRRASVRFEPETDQQIGRDLREETEQILRDTETPPAAGTQMSPSEVEEDDFTSRLMKAKQAALKGRQKRTEPGPPPKDEREQ